MKAVLRPLLSFWHSSESGVDIFSKNLGARDLRCFWAFTERRFVISYQRFRTTYRSRLQGSYSLHVWTQELSRSVGDYQFTLRNIPEELISRLNRGGSLKSHLGATSKFNTQDTRLVAWIATVQNVVTTDTWCAGFVHPWFFFFIWTQESTEMGDSASANPGNHCYIDSRKGDSHWVHNSDPTRTRTYIYLPPSTTCCDSTRPAPPRPVPPIGSATSLPQPLQV